MKEGEKALPHLENFL